MKIPKGFALNEAKSRGTYLIQLRRSLYGLKQSERMWYNRLSEYLSKEGYEDNLIFPCLFIKKFLTGFAPVAVYVNDIDLIGAPEELEKTADYVNKEFEMKDFEKIKFCLGLQIERNSSGILVHQSSYTKKVFK